MATIHDIKENINRIKELKDKVQSIIEAMSSIDPIDNCIDYARLLIDYENENESLQRKVSELRRSYQAFYDSYYGKNGQHPSKDFMDKDYIQLMLNNVSPLLKNTMGQFSPTIDSDYSRIKSTNYNRLRDYIIETIEQYPGYVIGRRRFFRFDNYETYNLYREQNEECGFDSIRIDDTSTEFGIDSCLIPAFIPQLFKKGIISEPVILQEDSDYVRNKHRINDENHYYPLDEAISSEVQKVSAKKNMVNETLNSKDKRCDEFGTISIGTYMGAIEIETKPRVLAKYGLLFDDMDFKPYEYVITVNDLAKALLPKKVLEAMFAKQDIPPRDTEAEKEGFLIYLQ